MKKSVNMLRPSLAIALAGGMFFSPAVKAQEPATQPDNSAQNKKQGTTADNQPDAKADRVLAANVRKAIMADKDLSTYAHNVKIIVRDGTVTLKGPVKSDDEKQKVKSDAESAASQGKVVDQLTVKQ
jgi:hyperosmotically inducible periplasmic protein